MNRNHPATGWRLALLLGATLALHGCNEPSAATPATTARAAAVDYAPVSVQHKLGTTVITRPPLRAVALDMNEVDFLDQLGVPVVGMPKDFVPHFLARYKDAAQTADIGSIVQPNLERVHAARPDLILITSLQANHYAELSEMAPTLHFDVDYRDSEAGHVAVVKQHLASLGQVFAKQELARQKLAALDAKLDQARSVTQGRPERALVVLHNNGAFSAFGVQSRYGFIFNDLGVKPAGSTLETGLHGQPISSEFIQQANPDILYVVDRTAVMEHRPAMTAETLGNPLLRQTNAWKHGRVVFVDPEAWYVTAASPTSLALIVDDVIKGYQH
ncbi:siderophore ABC transporter substrate-binding protein [Pseudomonas sichuanensis]|uniref:siderophore ABC transporter substrate-binding protein n=1 Tax=Pseudomonas TaxID=286 RepID=UPI00129BD709|nr:MULTISPECIES: siderophore ABC transporter substrate-binding protein [Pseudomonas]MDH0729853.1 siderophore ABC transporter substrate-binding protein [Pseudomonas sichuanensis]MDH1582425.1 siderophore ABC transporter substrate-binding protein [Pseudomonas sichuanensis]MDH1591224.1 siderophore ABC transporter substrate-binding protein [Pseudomonas sichuanensis]MDH1597418.1 siderophore ABC transporter substrate-binding protein [Pseudomonas sichuanensis]MDU9401272.1 siderophore ABC transporter s